MNSTEIKEGYINFINKEIIPTTVNITDSSKVRLSSSKMTTEIFGIKNATVIKLTQRNPDQSIQYTSDAGYYRVFKMSESDNNRIFKIEDQTFFNFIAACIEKDKYTQGDFNAKDKLFQYLTGLIDNKRYINQYRAAFTPSAFPDMNMWRQLEFYEFVDNQFKQKLFKEAAIASITSVELNQRSISFRGKQLYVYTSNSKYYNRAKSDEGATFVFGGEKPIVIKIDNNNPYFMFILRCLNKDKKAFWSDPSYNQRVRYTQFTQEGLSEYLDEFISNDGYSNEYDITFIPVKANSKTNQQLKAKHSNFVRNEIGKNIKDMGMVSTDGNALLFARSTAYGTPDPEIALVPDNILDEYKKSSQGKKVRKEIYEVPSDDHNFKFTLQCLNHNSTEIPWVRFATNERLLGYLENLPFNQQCKGDYISNFLDDIRKSNEKLGIPSTSDTYLPIGQSNDAGLPALSGSSSSTTSVSIAPTALLVFVLLQNIWPPLSSLYNYISHSIGGQKAKNKKVSGQQPSSNVTEVNESQIQLLGKTL